MSAVLMFKLCYSIRIRATISSLGSFHLRRKIIFEVIYKTAKVKFLTEELSVLFSRFDFKSIKQRKFLSSINLPVSLEIKPAGN